MSDEPEDKSSPWDRIDPRIQRTAWITSILVGLFTLSTPLATHLSKVPVPSLDVSVVVFQFVMIAWYFWIWFKQPVRLANWLSQHFFTGMIAISLLQVSYVTTRIDARYRIQDIGVAWIFVGCGWFALSILSAYVKDRMIWTAIGNVSDSTTLLSKMNGKIVDAMSSMSNNISSVMNHQQQAGKLDGGQLELIEHLRKEIEELKQSLPKKRKPKAELPPSTG